jgi:hypothetical protein
MTCQEALDKLTESDRGYRKALKHADELKLTRDADALAAKDAGATYDAIGKALVEPTTRGRAQQIVDRARIEHIIKKHSKALERLGR